RERERERERDRERERERERERIKSNNSAAIWLHRAYNSDSNGNNLEKLKRNFDKYVGFEIDLKWNEDGYFVIDHDNKNEKLKFEDLFVEIPDIIKKDLWIDLKDINGEIIDAEIREMDRIVKKNKLDKKKFFIENGNIEHLSKFTENGYLTSFYFAHGEMAEERLENWTKKSLELLEKYKISYISAHDIWFDYLVKNFPEYEKMYWYMGSEKKEERNLELLGDKKTKVILNVE
ncbi:MAG: hypothetical protein LBH46_03080, partial [Rickettsiales bacterium]|nr:hypothetical protein [Rickettsiales bacterium]